MQQYTEDMEQKQQGNKQIYSGIKNIVKSSSGEQLSFQQNTATYDTAVNTYACVQAPQSCGAAGKARTGRQTWRSTTARSAAWPCSCAAGSAAGRTLTSSRSSGLWSRRESGSEPPLSPSSTWTSGEPFRSSTKELPQRTVQPSSVLMYSPIRPDYILYLELYFIMIARY